MSFEDEIRRQKEEIKVGKQRGEMWRTSKLLPTDPVLTKPTGNIKAVIEEALPSINKIFSYVEDRHHLPYSSNKFKNNAPDNLVHVRNCYGKENDPYYYGRIKSFDVNIGTIKSTQYGWKKWDVEIWIFSDGDVAYTASFDDPDHITRQCRLLRPEDYDNIYGEYSDYDMEELLSTGLENIKPDDMVTLEDKITKLKNVEITPEDVGITAEVIRQKILDKVVEMQMRRERELQERTSSKSSKGCYIATAVYGSYDCPEVWVLRRYRDFTLLRNPFGQLFVKGYYAVSPTLVKLFGNTGWFRRFWKEWLDRIVARLRSKSVSDEPYRD